MQAWRHEPSVTPRLRCRPLTLRRQGQSAPTCFHVIVDSPRPPTLAGQEKPLCTPCNAPYASPNSEFLFPIFGELERKWKPSDFCAGLECFFVGSQIGCSRGQQPVVHEARCNTSTHYVRSRGRAVKLVGMMVANGSAGGRVGGASGRVCAMLVCGAGSDCAPVRT